MYFLFSSQEVLFSIVSVFCQIWEFPREWLLGEWILSAQISFEAITVLFAALFARGLV